MGPFNTSARTWDLYGPVIWRKHSGLYKAMRVIIWHCGLYKSKLRNKSFATEALHKSDWSLRNGFVSFWKTDSLLFHNFQSYLPSYTSLYVLMSSSGLFPFLHWVRENHNLFAIIWFFQMWEVTSENILVKTHNRKLVICKTGLPEAKRKKGVEGGVI